MFDRREWLQGMAMACTGLTMPIPSTVQEKPFGLRIDAARLKRRLEDLSVFARPDGGTLADGVSRVAYTEADLGARKYAISAMREAGLTPRIDAAGNIFGARGREPMPLWRAFCLVHISIRCRTRATLTET